MKTLLLIALVVIATFSSPAGPLRAESPARDNQGKPQLSMQDAIRIAEDYLQREKIDISKKFLSSAKYDHVGPWTEGTSIGRGPLWLLHWTTYRVSRPGGVTAVVVYMNGKVVHMDGI
jgi:hypothetical protein